jgi:hypothetical protein
MLKYLSKLTLDILPSLVATVMGAYIVNHYIIGKPATVAPVAAAISTSDDVANIPQAGVKAKGISEKTILDRSAVEKPQEKLQEKPQEKAAEKPADKPAETASIPLDTRRHQPPPREKTVAKIIPAPVPAVVPAEAPVVSAPNSAAPVEAAIAPEERRDVNDLARAAIERLRGSNDGSSHPQEATRVQEAPRVAAAPAVRPLPPPITVSTPSGETFDSATGPSQMKPSYATSTRIDGPLRPTPPADIPPPRPLDLRAEAAEPTAHDHATVADDVLSAAKSVFQAVLPK